MASSGESNFVNIVANAATTCHVEEVTSGTQVIDHNHPMFLYPFDMPRLYLITDKLTGAKIYDFCSRAMYMSLWAKNKLDFIDRSYRKEDCDSSLHHIWDRCNTFVFA